VLPIRPRQLLGCLQMTEPADMALGDEEQERLNAERWANEDFVSIYARSDLRAVEETLIARHRVALSGRVLELGCGAGRLTGHLCELAEVVHGVELSAAMVAYCRRTYPGALVEQGDLRDLSRFQSDYFDVVFAPYNVLDVLGDAERRRVLAEVQRVLRARGLLIMSSHNRGYTPPVPLIVQLSMGSPRRPLASLRALPRRLANRRRLRGLEVERAGYAVCNDAAHDFSLLHYYISRDAQARQLEEHRFELLECLDLDGREVEAGADAPRCAELHYVARALQRGSRSRCREGPPPGGAASASETA